MMRLSRLSVCVLSCPQAMIHRGFRFLVVALLVGAPALAPARHPLTTFWVAHRRPEPPLLQQFRRLRERGLQELLGAEQEDLGHVGFN